VAVLFPLWAIIVFFSLFEALDLQRSRGEAEEQAKRVASSYVRLVEEHASATFERTLTMLEHAVDEARSGRGDMAGLQQSLMALQARTPGVISISVTDDRGLILATTVGIPAGTSLGDRAYFQALKVQQADAPVITELVKGRLTDKWGILVARAMRTAGGRFTGMVVVNLGMSEYFAPFYESLSLSPGMAISLWDLNSRLLARYPHSEGSVGQVRRIPLVMDEVARGQSTGVVLGVSPLDGESRILGYRKLPAYPIVAIVGLREADYLAGWRVARERSIVAVIIVTAGGLLASVMSVRGRRLEREAARNGKRLALALRAAGAGTWHWNIRTGAIEWSLEQLAIHGGANPASFDEWLSMVVEEDRQRVSEWIAQVLKTRQSAFQGEFRVRGADGVVRWVANLGTLYYDRNGQPIGAEGVNIDISALKAAEAALETARDQALAAQARAEAASAARSRFLAAASHDLRQPVQSLLLLIEVIRSATAGTPLERVAVQMDRSLDALRMLLDSLLDISKLDAGVLRPMVSRVDLGELLGRLGEEYALRAAELGLGLQTVPYHGYVQTDPALLERILRNLIENALRYTPSGKVLIGCRRRAGCTRIDVIDTGIGIPADQLEVIFDEFHQVGNSARDRSQGLGLGLAIVRRLAGILDCRLEVKSSVGKGSRFSVELTNDVDYV
jgi:signal transduction histidine kinase